MARNPDVRDDLQSILDPRRQGGAPPDLGMILAHPMGLRLLTQGLLRPFRNTTIDKIAGIDPNGILLAATIAHELSLGLIPLRLQGTPRPGQFTLDLRDTALMAGDRILLIDDVLATGKSAESAVHRIERLGGDVIGLAVVLDHTASGGRARLAAMGIALHALYNSREPPNP